MNEISNRLGTVNEVKGETLVEPPYNGGRNVLILITPYIDISSYRNLNDMREVIIVPPLRRILVIL